MNQWRCQDRRQTFNSPGENSKGPQINPGENLEYVNNPDQPNKSNWKAKPFEYKFIIQFRKLI